MCRYQPPRWLLPVGPALLQNLFELTLFPGLSCWCERFGLFIQSDAFSGFYTGAYDLDVFVAGKECS